MVRFLDFEYSIALGVFYWEELQALVPLLGAGSCCCGRGYSPPGRPQLCAALTSSPSFSARQFSPTWCYPTSTLLPAWQKEGSKKKPKPTWCLLFKPHLTAALILCFGNPIIFRMGLHPWRENQTVKHHGCMPVLYLMAESGLDIISRMNSPSVISIEALLFTLL